MSINKSQLLYKNIEDKPQWIKGKSLSEQSRFTQQFMIEEAKKIKSGLVINGIKIHPWTYWHINFWKMLVDTKEGLPKTMVSDLRDNEWLIQEALFKAEKENKGIIMFGTRRGGKSAFESSYCGHRGHTIYGGELMCHTIVGTTQSDLDNVTNYMDFGFKNLHPFFKMDVVGKQWSKGVSLGTRNVDNSKDVFGTFFTANINKGALSASQSMAGYTPLTSVWDEALYEDSLIATPLGFRAIKDVWGGHAVIGADGKVCRVIDRVDVGVKDLYEIKFSNGVKIKACGDHLWNVKVNSGSITTLSTLELIKQLKNNKLSVPKTAPIQLSKKEVEIDPYLVGEYLAKKNKKRPILISKKLPDSYIFNCESVRASVIAGLMSSSKPEMKGGITYVRVPNKGLRDSVVLIAESLGIQTSIDSKDITKIGLHYGKRYNNIVSITP